MLTEKEDEIRTLRQFIAIWTREENIANRKREAAGDDSPKFVDRGDKSKWSRWKR